MEMKTALKINKKWGKKTRQTKKHTTTNWLTKTKKQNHKTKNKKQAKQTKEKINKNKNHPTINWGARTCDSRL